MAQVNDVDPDLRALARRVPPERLEYLSPLELQLRAEEAAALLAEAETEGPGHRADRLRRQAKRVLEAMTPAGFALALETYGEQIRQAELDGADHRAARLRSELAELDRMNPQPSPARAVAHAKARLAEIPPAPQVNSITRRFGKRRGR